MRERKNTQEAVCQHWRGESERSKKEKTGDVGDRSEQHQVISQRDAKESRNLWSNPESLDRGRDCRTHFIPEPDNGWVDYHKPPGKPLFPRTAVRETSVMRISSLIIYINSWLRRANEIWEKGARFRRYGRLRYKDPGVVKASSADDVSLRYRKTLQLSRREINSLIPSDASSGSMNNVI